MKSIAYTLFVFLIAWNLVLIPSEAVVKEDEDIPGADADYNCIVEYFNIHVCLDGIDDSEDEPPIPDKVWDEEE